jgi:hypothetical protein
MKINDVVLRALRDLSLAEMIPDHGRAAAPEHKPVSMRVAR